MSRKGSWNGEPRWRCAVRRYNVVAIAGVDLDVNCRSTQRLGYPETPHFDRWNSHLVSPSFSRRIVYSMGSLIGEDGFIGAILTDTS